jgi:hypothetical protein
MKTLCARAMMVLIGIAMLTTPARSLARPANNPDDCTVCEVWDGAKKECLPRCPPDKECCAGSVFVQCIDPQTHGCCNGTVYHKETQDCCNGTVFNKADKCCSPNRTLIPKEPITDLADCPNRVANDRPHEIDGCSWSPDFIIPCPWVSITPACNNHDECYQTCGSDKSACDSNLYNDIVAICRANQLTCPLGACESEAVIYYAAVVALGGPAYNNDQKKFCKCCPP